MVGFEGGDRVVSIQTHGQRADLIPTYGSVYIPPPHETRREFWRYRPFFVALNFEMDTSDTATPYLSFLVDFTVQSWYKSNEVTYFLLLISFSPLNLTIDVDDVLMTL